MLVKFYKIAVLFCQLSIVPRIIELSPNWHTIFFVPDRIGAPEMLLMLGFYPLAFYFSTQLTKKEILS